MGQVLRRLQNWEDEFHGEEETTTKDKGKQLIKCFPDLQSLPPELSLLILSNLNATDLCLAGCVWDNLANDELLWHGLCIKQWGYVSAYNRCRSPFFSFKRLYLQLDEATLTFNADPHLGMDQMIRSGLLDDNAMEIAKFIHFSRNIDKEQRRIYLESRRDVLDELIKLQDFENQFLPNALRKFFQETRPPNERGSYLHDLVDKFADRFCACNPTLGLSKDAVYVVCFSLILLSVDLSSPHIKNKMSKREFIRNTRQAAQGINDDFAGHLYDNIYLIGHVAPKLERD